MLTILKLCYHFSRSLFLLVSQTALNSLKPGSLLNLFVNVQLNKRMARPPLSTQLQLLVTKMIAAFLSAQATGLSRTAGEPSSLAKTATLSFALKRMILRLQLEPATFNQKSLFLMSALFSDDYYF